jgi:hypothetical protein
MYAILGFRLGVLRLTSLGIQKTQRMGIVKRPYIDWSGQLPSDHSEPTLQQHATA